MSLSGKVVIITGASSGIGEALAHELSAHQARLGLIARRRDRLEALAETIKRKGGIVEWSEGDVSDRRALRQAVERLTQRLGPVDVMIANAGVAAATTIEPFNVEDAERVLRINLFGVIYTIDAVLPEMLKRRSGQIVGISSLASYKGLPGSSAYCASKAAVNSFLEGLRIQLRGTGVRVTTICPGFVRSEMTIHDYDQLPMRMEAAPAAKRIVRAIQARRKVYSFPWPMRLLLECARWAPDHLIAATGMTAIDPRQR